MVPSFSLFKHSSSAAWSSQGHPCITLLLSDVLGAHSYLHPVPLTETVGHQGTPLLQPPIVTVTSLDSYLLLPKDTKALHGCLTCPWKQHRKNQILGFWIPSQSLTQHCHFGERVGNPAAGGLVEGTAKGQGCLFAGWK